MKLCNGKSRHIILGFCVFYLLIASYGCASKPSFQGKGNLCGLVVDEKNRPVGNAVVSCWKGPVCLQSSLSNGAGLFSFSDIPSGSYEISAEKDNYALLKQQKYRFSNPAAMLCCQMNSLDYVLASADEKIICGDYKELYELLDNISLAKNSPVKLLILFYKTYGKLAEGDEKEAATYLKKLERLNKAYAYPFTDEIEVLRKKVEAGKVTLEAEDESI